MKNHTTCGGRRRIHRSKAWPGLVLTITHDWAKEFIDEWLIEVELRLGRLYQQKLAKGGSR